MFTMKYGCPQSVLYSAIFMVQNKVHICVMRKLRVFHHSTDYEDNFADAFTRSDSSEPCFDWPVAMIMSRLPYEFLIKQFPDGGVFGYANITDNYFITARCEGCIQTQGRLSIQKAIRFSQITAAAVWPPSIRSNLHL